MQYNKQSLIKNRAWNERALDASIHEVQQKFQQHEQKFDEYN